MRRSALLIAAALGAGLIGCSGDRETPTNVLILSLDTTRADRFGFFGHEPANTPNFDRFVAERAAHYRNAITAIPLTLPSHTTIMTGTYPVHHGVHDNDGFVVANDVSTLAELLAEAGFLTSAFVAAFPLDSSFNLDQGFDLYDDNFQQDWAEGELEARTRLSFGFVERSADLVNKAFFRWLDSREEGPFFAWLHYFDAHSPYEPPPPFGSMFPTSPYDGEIAFMDEQFGQLLRRLDEAGLADETLIVVVGDHGEGLGEHGEVTHAGFVFDSTMRVPLMIALPSRSTAGVTVDRQVRTVDLAPTVLSALGLEVPEVMQGSSLLPLDAPADESAEEAILENHFPEYHYGWGPLRALRTDDWKYVVAPSPELYALDEDPGEQRNLVAELPDVAARLEERLFRLARTVEWPDPKRSTAAGADDEMLRKLEALGYMGGGDETSRSRPFPSPAELSEMPNPLDRTLVLRHANFANELLRTRHFFEAARASRQGLKIDPDNPRLQFSLAGAMAGLGHHEAALEEFHRAALLAPDFWKPHFFSGRILLILGRYEEAERELSIAANLSGSEADTLRSLANAILNQERSSEAADILLRVVAEGEARWRDHVDLGNLLVAAQRWDEAETAFRGAIELDPYSAYALRAAASFFYQREDPATSLELLERALELEPEHGAARFQVAEILAADGRTAEAIELLESLAGSSTGGNWSARAQERIEELRAGGDQPPTG